MQRVAIIGAGPAGCTAAILLARAGVDVTLIEQHRFPRDKVCGECLSAMGIDVLNRLRLAGDVRRLGATRLNRAILYSTDGSAADLGLPREMWGISRAAFDSLLLTTSASSGVRIIQPARVEHGSTIRDLHTNAIHSIEDAILLIAGGKSIATQDFGLKAHFENVHAPADAIELFGVRGHYGGIAPIEGGRWNIAFSVPQARIREHRGDLDAMWRTIVGENAALSEQLKHAHRVTPWLVSPLSRSSVCGSWPDRTIPIGNSAAAIEPIGGEGMGLAMRSAELAAECLIDAFQHGTEPNLARLRSDYRKLWRVRRLVCRAAGLVIASPRLSRLVIPFIGGNDPLTGLALQALGKA